MTTIPGYVNSLEDLPDDDSLAEALVQDALKDTGALAWGRFAHWPSKWFSSMIGPPTLALPQCDLARMLERLEHSHSEPASAAAASADASSSRPQSERTSSTHQGIVWTGTAVPSPYTVQPGEFDFRFKYFEVGSNEHVSSSFVKAVVEQGLGEFVHDVFGSPFVFIRPGYPYTDDQEIKKYNLDISFASQTRFISFMSSPDRIKLLELVKANSSQHGAPIGAADALARPPTLPYHPHPRDNRNAPSGQQLNSLGRTFPPQQRE
ncbi:hypothetical protein Rhopal_002118-T1 [Rhodotorula paludigena]|uniref:Uncharacterized protein n=1 Tax=Rhodotorula paludigena TaxID=86838 RepID=A0AAV5GH03_9BASI|nr:hypothetical protein Rhopal_002118-T1 [Rhodotorula paludigena]